MYPDNQPLPSDYLNQIAPQTNNKPSLFSNKILLGFIVVALVLFILIGLTNIASGGTNQTKTLIARLNSTTTVVEDSMKKIKSSQLRAVNSDLKIYLTNTNRDILSPLAKEKNDYKKIDKKILALESETELLAKLEDARLNTIFDSTYAREMAYKLDTIINLMQKIYKESKNKDLKLFLEEAYKNLVPIQKQFEDYNDTTGS